MEQTGGSIETLKEIVELFATESAKLMKRIQDAIAIQDASGLQRAAHTLKGSIRVFGAERAATVAQRLEKLGNDKNFDGAEEVWALLAEEVERLLPMLAELGKSGMCIPGWRMGSANESANCRR